MRFGRSMFKRCVDIIGSVLGLVVFSPVLLILAGLIKWKLGSPILFLQTRAGRGGVPFRVIKFRTMLDTASPDGEILPDEARLTSFGKLLRSTSLDELPEFINVLHGDMSLVGPRPLLMEYLPLYTAEQAKRHDVRPGITGLAQSCGRNALEWEERFALDVWYVDHHSFFLDMRILWRTFWLVIKREGISGSNDVTMRKFKGKT